jgi:hypothetical protein
MKDRTQYKNITQNPPDLFLGKKQRKKMMGNIVDNRLRKESNIFKFYQI